MRVRDIARAAAIGAVAVTLGAATAASQTVTFSTTGAFSGGSCGGGTSCSFGGFTLTYSGLVSSPWAAPTDVSFGSFAVACNACAPGSAASVLSGSTFMLTINQTGPTSGSASFSGTLSGTLGWNPSSSSLFWNPAQSSIQIGGTTYGLIEQDLGAGGNFGINIAAPNVGANPMNTIVKADVATTATPEPATLALVATGLLAIVPVARRRRRR